MALSTATVVCAWYSVNSSPIIRAIPGSIHSRIFRMTSSCRPMALKNRRTRQKAPSTASVSAAWRSRSISHLYIPRVRQGVTSQAAAFSPTVIQKPELFR